MHATKKATVIIQYNADGKKVTWQGRTYDLTTQSRTDIGLIANNLCILTGIK
jgi:hypothetical protein